MIPHLSCWQGLVGAVGADENPSGNDKDHRESKANPTVGLIPAMNSAHEKHKGNGRTAQQVDWN